MSNLVEINNTELSIKEFNGQRVVTFNEIDTVHERPNGTARRNFNANKKYLTENEDYLVIKPNDLRMDEIRTSGIYQVNPRGTTFITETGYLLLVKSFTDDLAWKVQRQLVSTYFKAKEVPQNNTDSQFMSALSQMTETLSSINDRLSSLEKNQSKPKLPASKYSNWKSNVFKKFYLIMNFTNENSDDHYKITDIMGLIFKELQDTYNIEISDYDEMYKCEYGLDLDTKVQTLDIINHYKDIRDMFTLTLNSILERLHLENEPELKSTRNIFDELAAKLENEKVS